MRHADTALPDPLLQQLQRTRRWLSVLTAALVLLAAALLAHTWRAAGPLQAAHIITGRLELRDADGVTRVLIEQYPPSTGRQSRATGITLYDRQGHERGGFVTYDDDRVGLTLDAGVGSGADDSLRDRLGGTGWA